MATVAETIRKATRTHLLERRSLLFGQCVRAVGWVGGTIPELTEEQGIVELPTCDVAGPGFVVGAALAGRRPIFVCRYQGFMHYNLASIANYAAKSKEMWGRPCPLFVRAIAMEGGIGPVAGGSHHSMAMRMPGLPVAAPLTPAEWREVWDHFLAGDDPVYCSEHRLSFGSDVEFADTYPIRHPQLTIFAISAARFQVMKAAEVLRARGYEIAVHHVLWLKPFVRKPYYHPSLVLSKVGLVVDSDYATAGAATSIAHELTLWTGKPVHALGLADRTAGFAKHLDNLTPSCDQIVEKALTLIENRDK